MKQSRIDIITGEILETRSVKPPLAGVASQWVPIVEEDKPAFDPAAETVEKTVMVAGDKSCVNHQWTKRSLTAKELSDRADAATQADADKTDRNQLRARIAALRDGTATNRQVQSALAKLLRLTYSEDAE